MPPGAATPRIRSPFPVEQVRLGVRIVPEGLALPSDAAVGGEEVQPSIVVEVHKARSEPCELPAERGQGLPGRFVAEQPALVAEEEVRLGLEVHDQQVGVSIAVHVGVSDTHSRLHLAGVVGGAAALKRLVVEATVVSADPEEVHGGVVGDEDVEPTVAREVADRDAKPVAQRLVDAEFRRDVRESPVAVVAVESVRRGAAYACGPQ